MNLKILILSIMKTNTSILQCPECGKALVNIGSKVTRIHPVARFIENHGFTLVIVLGFVSAGTLFSLYIFGIFQSMKYFAFVLPALLFTPSLVMYFLLRCYSLYRLTNCPYCGFEEKQRLGRSSS